MSSTQKNILVLSALALIEGVIAFIWLFSFPTNRQTYSGFRLAGLLIILSGMLIAAAVLIYFQTPKAQIKRVDQFLNSNAKLPLSFLLITVSLSIWTAVLFKDQWLSYINESTFIRLLPIATYSLLLCLQAGVFFLLTGRPRKVELTNVRSLGKPLLFLVGAFLSVWLIVSVSHIGLIHDVVGLSWGPPGTPITFAQVNLVLVISFLITFGFLIIRSHVRKISLLPYAICDIIIFFVLWGVAVALWWNQPMSPTHFSPPPMPPNNEYYPYSDALGYDVASFHLLYGSGFANQLVRRPLYVGMLAFFHKIAGPGYKGAVFLQVLLLALIPALIFLLTSKLSSRLAGLIAGGLIIFREKNAIALSSKIVTSHAKLMMSDMATMLCVVLFVYAAIKLLFKEKGSNWELGIIGACLGLSALIRAQVLILLLPVVLFIFISRRPWRQAVNALIFTVLGLVLAISPWLWRNWNLSGTFALADFGEMAHLARNYSLTPSALPLLLPGETAKEFSARLQEDVFRFISTYPSHVLFFISNHFFHNLITSAIYIAPMYSTDAPPATVAHLPFWDVWDGRLDWPSGLSILINLTIIAFGMIVASRKDKLSGWFPFTVFLFYSFGNAIARTSGWRFSLPADWIVAVYFSIGIAYLPSKIKLLFAENTPGPIPHEEAFKIKKSSFRAIAFCFLIALGAALPVVERLIPTQNFDRFTNNAKAAMSGEKPLFATGIDSFLEQKNTVLLSGIALYPRYVRPGSRISLSGAPENSKYLYLWLINESNHQIMLPLSASPKSIPDAALVSVIGCRKNGYISAWVVIVHGPSQDILIRDPLSPPVCH